MTKRSFFWASYADLMSSLFFIMLVLFVATVAVLQKKELVVKESKAKVADIEAKVAELEGIVAVTEEQKEQLENILQLDKQFKVLSESSALVYIEDNKTFVAKDFIGIEIFKPDSDVIKAEYLGTVDKVGNALQQVVENLYEENPQLSFQLVIEGTAAMPYEQVRNPYYNRERKDMYELSYRRALALYLRWRGNGLNFRDYNTEVLICGSGYNGINRDTQNEDNNKRFVIQIIPKVSKPESFTNNR